MTHPFLERRISDAGVHSQYTPLAGGGDPCVDFVIKIVFCIILGEHVTFEAVSAVRDCEYLFIRYSCQSLHIRKTRETIHQRWIPQKNLERCVGVNVS